MNSDDMLDYVKPAIDKFNGPAKWSGFVASHEMRRFQEYLGIYDFSQFLDRPTSADFPMREDLKRLLIAYVGPHGDTIMRAYRIQKGLEK